MLTNVKVGDLIKGTKEADNYYGMTTNDMLLGKVKSVKSYGIDIEILNHEDSKEVGRSYLTLKHDGGYPFERVAQAPEAEESAEDVFKDFLEGLAGIAESFQELSDVLETASDAMQNAVQEATEPDEETAPEHDFKVGDKVELTVDGDLYPLYGFTRGNIYTITSITAQHETGNSIQLDRDEGAGTGYATADQLQKAVELKAGDKVKLLSGGSDFPLFGFFNGNVYEVVDPEYISHADSALDVVVRIKELDSSSGYGYAKAEQVEKVTEPVKQGEEVLVPKFKIGDSVVVVDDSITQFKVGDKATVTCIDDHSRGYIYAVEKDDREQLLYEEHLKAVEEAVPKFKVGDKVKLTKGNRYTSDYTVGETYEISEPLCYEEFAEIVGGGQETAYPYLKDLELVEEETYDFKVGDTVEVTCVAGTFEFNVGDRGVIEEVDGSSVPIRVRKEGEHAQWFKEHQLKLADSLKTAVKFKVGDIVEFPVEGDYHGDYDYNGVVISVDEDDFFMPYLVYVDGASRWFESRDIKLVK